MSSSVLNLILPGDPEFDWTLMNYLPPHWRQVADAIGQQCAFICSPDSGLLRPATDQDLDEYLYGGEYDERIEQIGPEPEEDPLELDLDLQSVSYSY